MRAMVEVRGIVNRFGAQVVHDGLDMVAYEGEVFGIVGGSGSGKSVLLRTILGLRHPQAGEVRLEGRDITHLSWDELRTAKAGYGVTFQQGALYSALTVLQNIQLPMIEHLSLPPDALDALARLKVAIVGLPAESAAKYPAQLSGGMIKRAALARALALDPALVFLDEPTSGLDPIGAAEFDELIAKLRDTLGLTVYMVTHDLDSLFSVCDRIAVLGKKRVLVAGTIDDMLDCPDEWVQSYFRGKRARSIPRSEAKKPARV